MIMLSQLVRFHVLDENGRRARLVDVAIESLDPDYPVVGQFLIHARPHDLRRVPWAAVTAFDRKRGQMRVANLEAADHLPAGEWPAGVWLERDVLDATIVNLWRR